MNQAEIFKAWSNGFGGAIGQAGGVRLMEPIYVKMSDEFFITDEDERRIAANRSDTDLYIFTGIQNTGSVCPIGTAFRTIRIPGRAKKPIAEPVQKELSS